MKKESQGIVPCSNNIRIWYSPCVIGSTTLSIVLIGTMTQTTLVKLVFYFTCIDTSTCGLIIAGKPEKRNLKYIS